MRESSGRTTSSKRPVSSCSSSVTSAWKLPALLVDEHDVARRRCPSRSGATALRLRRDVDQPLLCHRPGTLDGGPDGLPHRAVQRDVLRAVGAHVDQRRAVGARARASSAARNGSGAATRSCAQPVERGGVGEVDPVRRGDVLLERRRPAPATGRKWKMPPPSLSSSTIASGRPSRRAASSPPMSCSERDVAGEQHDRAGRRGGDPERGRRRAVDPVRAAVGEHARRRRAGGEERLDVADRHRGRDHERRLGGQPHAELGGDARLGQLGRPPSTPAIALRRGAVGAGPLLQPAARPAACAGAVAASASSTARGSAGSSVAAAPPGSCHAFSGSNAIWSVAVAEAVQPLAQRLGGRQVADAQRRGRARAPRPRRVAQQRVVVRDRRRPAARAGRRLGQQREPGALGERGQRGGRAAGRAPRARRRRSRAAAARARRRARRAARRRAPRRARAA